MSDTATTASPLTIIQHPFAFRLLQVQRATRLTPGMVRVTLGGAALTGFRSDAPDDGARMFFPPDPTDTSWAPSVVEGKVTFPDGVAPLPGREYTPRRYDAAANELDIDFVIHGHGPSATWAAQARPGHYVGLSGPRRSRMLTGQVDWYLLAGDESALPSISRRLEELPAGTRAFVVLEVANAAEEQPIATRADMELRWLHRDGAGSDSSMLLTNAIRELRFPDGAVFAWSAGEASGQRALRRHLLQERRLPAERVRTTGYWKRAEANYDHHQPLDD
jgi:NADPH-dependent ferric siderophore reductase